MNVTIFVMNGIIWHMKRQN